jgi:hypothetical protein
MNEATEVFFSRMRELSEWLDESESRSIEIHRSCVRVFDPPGSHTATYDGGMAGAIERAVDLARKAEGSGSATITRLERNANG